MSEEDKLTNTLIEKAYDSNEVENVEPEVHYNHYGSRGVVDLVITKSPEVLEAEVERAKENNPLLPERIVRAKLTHKSIDVYEVKSASAVQSDTGANAVLRQFNRHRNYFFQGSDYRRNDYDSVRFHLIFCFSEWTHAHVQENESIYESIHGNNDAVVHFGHPENGGRISAFNREGLFEFEKLNELLTRYD